jgi:hypothetical protein
MYMTDTLNPEKSRGIVRQHYTKASENEPAYFLATTALEKALVLLPEDRVLLAYKGALHGVGALYIHTTLDQFGRVNKALQILNELVGLDADPATVLELRLIRASFCEGLPLIFLQDGLVRLDAKAMIRLLENHLKDLPQALIELCLSFLTQKVKLSFMEADSLLEIRRSISLSKP